MRNWMNLIENASHQWRNGYYHGTTETLRVGECPHGTVTYLTTDRGDADMYGKSLYKCEAILGKMADLWSESSPAFQAVLEHFSAKHPREFLVKYLKSHKMWQNKKLELKIRNFLLKDQGYDSIDFRDTSWEGEEVGSIVTLSKNVRVTEILKQY